MLTVSWARTAFGQANKLLLFTRHPLIELNFSQLEGATLSQAFCVLRRTQHIRCSGFGSMADSGSEQGAAVAAGGEEGEPVVKSAKQLKKDAKKKEKMEKFQQKQAKMAGQQKQTNNSGSEVRESVVALVKL